MGFFLFRCNYLFFKEKSYPFFPHLNGPKNMLGNILPPGGDKDEGMEGRDIVSLWKQQLSEQILYMFSKYY